MNIGTVISLKPSLIIIILGIIMAPISLFSQQEQRKTIYRYVNGIGAPDYTIELNLYNDSTYVINHFRHYVQYGQKRFVSDDGSWAVKKNKIIFNSFSEKKMNKKERNQKMIFRNRKCEIDQGRILLSRSFLQCLYPINWNGKISNKGVGDS